MANMIPEFVSVIIPTLNEEDFIDKCLDSVITQDYSRSTMEILVVDGMSKDNTRKIVQDYMAKYPYIRLLDNPKAITPAAFNVGIKNARGNIIMIMGAHSTYKKDYISKCVQYLFDYQADNVGGILIIIPRVETVVARIIAEVLSSAFGIGNSAFRIGSKEVKWVDTVFGGTYRREIFDKVGLFNENLSSSQDLEFNLRLKKASGKILLAPDIISYYYVRSDLISFTKNNLRNGFWAVYPLKFVRMPFKIRHYVPFLFVFSLIGSIFLSIFWWRFIFLFLLISGLYISISIYFSFRIASDKKDWRYFMLLPILFTLLHVVYGIGSLLGLLAVILPIKPRKTIK